MSKMSAQNSTSVDGFDSFLVLAFRVISKKPLLKGILPQNVSYRTQIEVYARRRRLSKAISGINHPHAL